MSFSIFIPTIEIGPPYIGPMAGLRRYSYSLVKSLVNHDIDIHIASTTELPSDDELLNRENIHFYKLPPQISARGAYSTQTHFYAKNHRRFSKQALSIFQQINKEKQFSLIHSTEASGYAFAKAKRKKHIEIPLILSVHGAVTTGNLKSRLFVKRPYSRILRRTVGHCNVIITNTPSLLDKIKRLTKKIKERVETVPHSLNCKKFSQIPKLEDVEDFRDKYDLNLGKAIVLMQGPFISRKSQHEVIEFFPSIMREFPNTTFLIVGEGPLLQNIKENIVNLQIEDSVRITGYINDDELLLAYHISDVLLYPAKEGGFGTPLIEAMASGLPIVAADKPPMNEMLPPDCGWLYPQNDMAKIVDIVNELISNKEASQQIVFETQKYALKNYDHQIVGKKLMKIYKDTLEE